MLLKINIMRKYGFLKCGQQDEFGLIIRLNIEKFLKLKEFVLFN